jgi:ribose transport system substrate-binding protein
MKKLLGILLVLCLVFGMVACGAPATDTEVKEEQQETGGQQAPADESVAAAAESYNFGLSLPSLEFTFFATMKTAVEKQYPTDRIQITVYNAENNQEKQNKDIEDMISKGVDGIVLIPITVEGAVPAIKYANEKDVPVITVDRAVTPETGVETVSFVGSDHYPMGVQAAEMLIQALEEKFPDAEKWNVVELEGTPGASAAIERGSGIKDTIAAEPRINLVSSLNGEFSTTTATSVAEDVLTANPDLHGFICQNDMMAEGCYQALVNANRLGEIVIIGIDGQLSTVQKIVEGNIHGTVIQYPDRMAIKGIELLADSLDGKTVEDTVFVPTEAIPPSEAKRFVDEGLAW